jgi:hypothetical protein
MKLAKLVMLAMVAAGITPMLGQDAAQSTVDLHPKASPEILPTPLPANSPELPELSQLDEIFKQTSLGTTADELRRHAEWRKLENQVANDPAVAEAKKTVGFARTDLEKRKRLNNYYNIYYQRMEAQAKTPEMKAVLEAFKAAHLGMQSQPRVRPTPTPSPTATPSPLAPAVHIEPPLPSAAPAPSPALLPTPIPVPSAIPSPSATPSPTVPENSVH